MPKTRADLVNEVAELLFIVGTGQTLPAEDGAVIDAKIDPVLENLSRRQVLFVGDPESIDDAVFDDLAILVAEVCGPKYGRPRDTGTRLEAEGRLIELQAGAGSDEPVKAEYF